MSNWYVRLSESHPLQTPRSQILKTDWYLPDLILRKKTHKIKTFLSKVSNWVTNNNVNESTLFFSCRACIVYSLIVLISFILITSHDLHFIWHFPKIYFIFHSFCVFCQIWCFPWHFSLKKIMRPRINNIFIFQFNVKSPTFSGNLIIKYFHWLSHYLTIDMMLKKNTFVKPCFTLVFTWNHSSAIPSPNTEYLE